MKITVEIPIKPKQKYCVDKTGEYECDCPHVYGMEQNKYYCCIFLEVLETSRDGDSIRCKQCKEAEK